MRKIRDNNYIMLSDIGVSYRIGAIVSLKVVPDSLAYVQKITIF